MKIRINKFSKVPLYKQIKDSILESIKRRELRHLDLLPTEKDICDAYLLSRSVVRRAYEALIETGYVERRQGYGTYVTNRYQFIGSNKEIFRFNRLAHKEIIHLDMREDHLQAYPLLKLSKGEPCYDVTYRLSIDSFPISIQKAFFPKKLFPKLENQVQNSDDLRALIEQKYNHQIGGIYSDFVSTTCSHTDAMLLDIPHKSAVHFVTTVIKDKQRNVLCVMLHTMPGDYVKFEEVVR